MPCAATHLNSGQPTGLAFSRMFAFLGMGFHTMRDEINSPTGVSEVVARAPRSRPIHLAKNT